MNLPFSCSRRSRMLLALVAMWSLDAAAQLPAAPQVVLGANPSQQQAETPAPTAAPVTPAPAAGPSLSAPSITIRSNPGATPAAADPAPAPTATPTPVTPAATAAPKVQPAPAQAVTTATPDGVGTTIFGEQEAPIGLYITPWKDDYAERGLDRPARLLDEAMEPIDPATFRRQIEYYETITEYRRKQRGEIK